MMLVRPLVRLLPAYGRSADSLLVLVTSFERRCLGFAERALAQTPSYRVDRTLVLSYSDRGDRSVKDRVKRFASTLTSYADRLTVGGRVDRRNLEPFEISDAFENFLDCFHSIDNDSSVVVDVSTMTKLHVFYLLEAARASKRVALLRLVYTRARYGRYDTLSWGAEEPVILPMFGAPRLTPHNREHLVLVCGLEPDRAYSIWRRFGQSRCTQVFVDSGDADLDRCASRAVHMNSFDPTAEKVFVNAFAPYEFTDRLGQIYQDSKSRGEYLYVASLATKWEIVATWLFFRSSSVEPDAGLLYSAPGRLNVAGHTLEELGECICADVWDTHTA